MLAQVHGTPCRILGMKDKISPAEKCKNSINI